VKIAEKPAVDDLIEAVKRKDLPAVKNLLEASADPAAGDSKGYTAMSYAMKNHDLEAVKLLMSVG
jgi:ankyrin repeat protein